MDSGDERMNPSNPAKFGVAFAAGLVVALAAVTVYVKTSGLHVQEAAALAPAVAQNKQPESLNAGKMDEPVAAQTPKAIDPPVVAPISAPPPPAAAMHETVEAPTPATRHSAAAPRAHYPPYSSPESQSTIRVEVSQMKQPTQPVAGPIQPPIPAPAAQQIRTVNEEQPAPAQSYNSPAPAAPAAPQPHTVTIQTGTSLVVRLGETLSTDHNYSGDTFRATLDRPLILDGFVIADKGSKVLGKITGIDKAGKFEGTSNLQLALTEINTTDGQRVRIQTGFFDKKGAPNNGAGVAKVGGGAVLGAVIGALAGGGKGAAIGAGAGGAIGAGTAMAGKGRPAVIPTETKLTFQLSSPTTITERLN
jgi:hypothetical protein